ncbi:MAG: hypothetical protein ACE5EL_07730, partial [Anaerolineae bacterium]
LSFLPLKIDGRGYMWSAPLSVFTVFAMVWHQPWTHIACWVAGGMILLIWLWRLLAPGHNYRPVLPRFLQTTVLAAGIGGMLLLNCYGYADGGLDDQGDSVYKTVAWAWYAPIGSTVAFVWGYVLADWRRGAVAQ